VKISIRAVGKLRDRRLESLCEDYLGRARRHLPIEAQEVSADSALLATKTPAQGRLVVAMDPEGKSWNTAQLRQFIEEGMNKGLKNLVFLIGGASGLTDATKRGSDMLLSLTPLTLPHRLARLLLCEQVYRCLSSIRGEPYDK